MIESWAHISDCGRYRYSLGRMWDRRKPLLGIIGLNCSTADATKNDPTVTREIMFAVRDGFGGLLKGNVFAYRATDPKAMMAQGFDAIGPDNDRHIQVISCVSGKLVAAWGVHGSFLDQDRHIAELLRHKELFSFGSTKEGHPKHPLYLSKETALVPWKPYWE